MVPPPTPLLRYSTELQQHRMRMERSVQGNLHYARAKKHSLAEAKASNDAWEARVAKDSDAENARQKESLGKLAQHMAQNIDADAVRRAAVRVRVRRPGSLARLKSNHV